MRRLLLAALLLAAAPTALAAAGDASRLAAVATQPIGLAVVLFSLGLVALANARRGVAADASKR